jgi:drug/metabolite transporter (DMT)-like permease
VAVTVREHAPRATALGPWLVALGAGLWGTESAWRIPLNDLFEADVIVWWEHVVLVALALPFVLPRLHELRRVSPRAIGWLIFSGVSGSAVGTVLFTMALKHGNESIANVVLNVQPVLSTTAACLLFKDRLAPAFFPWAVLAIAAGVALVVDPSTGFTVDGSVPYAFGCAVFWGLSTVAGRGVMTEMSLPLAAGLRVIVGLVTMTITIAALGHLDADSLWPATASAASTTAIEWLVLLATLSGGIPLVIYFAGLARTRASTAGYFEMMQTIVAVGITWGFFDAPLARYQVFAALVLVGAVAMVQHAQASIGE